MRIMFNLKKLLLNIISYLKLTGRLTWQRQSLKQPSLSPRLLGSTFPRTHPHHPPISMVLIGLSLVLIRWHNPWVWAYLLLGSLIHNSIFTEVLRIYATQTSNYHFPEPVSHFGFVFSTVFSQGFSIPVVLSSSILSLGWMRTKRWGRKKSRDPHGQVVYSHGPLNCFIYFRTPACHCHNFFTEAQISEGQRSGPQPRRNAMVPLICLHVCLFVEMHERKIAWGDHTADLFFSKRITSEKSRWRALLKNFSSFISSSNNTLNSHSQQPHMLLSRAGDLWLKKKKIPSEIQNPVKQQRFRLNSSQNNRCLAPRTKHHQTEAPMECMKEGIPETLSQPETWEPICHCWAWQGIWENPRWRVQVLPNLFSYWKSSIIECF